MSVHRCAAWLAVCHTSTLQNIQDILLLGEEKTVWTPMNSNAQEVTQGAEIFHRELPLQS
jgi:hypothetical protein